MIFRERLYTEFRQSGNTCILASYAVAAHYYTKIPILEYFKAYCQEFGLTVTLNDYQKAYDDHFHTYCHTQGISGMDLIKRLNDTSDKEEFKRTRSLVSVHKVDSVKDDVVKYTALLQEAEVIIACTHKNGNFHAVAHFITVGGKGYIETDGNSGIKLNSQNDPFSISTDGLLFSTVEYRDLTEISKESILDDLSSINDKNYRNNCESISEFSYYYQFKMTEQEILSLIFMKSSEIKELVPNSVSRTLKCVSGRASMMLRVGDTSLSQNWNLNDIQLIKSDALSLPVLLRDTKDSERVHRGEWYIQDGLHRLLHVGINYVMSRTPIPDFTVNCATNRPISIL